MKLVIYTSATLLENVKWAGGRKRKRCEERINTEVEDVMWAGLC